MIDQAWQRISPVLMCTYPRTVDVHALYDGFDAAGLQYGPGYRTLLHVWGGERDGLARLSTRLTHEGTQVHPADVDDALCTSAAITTSRSLEPRLPFAVGDAQLQPTRGKLWAVRHASCTNVLTALR